MKDWIHSLIDNPKTSLMGLGQILLAVVMGLEVYKGTIDLATGLPIALTSFAGGIGSLVAGDANKKPHKNFSKEPAGNCNICRFKSEVGTGIVACSRRGHVVAGQDTCDDWKPLTEIRVHKAGD